MNADRRDARRDRTVYGQGGLQMLKEDEENR